ncbi:hypothetical protein KIN20_028066 [Parelaphostrongylus tenuis]|uniref:Uncharacterized protein n=1 Tax=Parelaphostrongylus tenuis TaxID=148309 RepID=A0AAD5R097_PARTN|nr:hypothetical protein KIN20_028066 [Parelaphostrongylus tenuis]
MPKESIILTSIFSSGSTTTNDPPNGSPPHRGWGGVVGCRNAKYNGAKPSNRATQAQKEFNVCTRKAQIRENRTKNERSWELLVAK